MVGITTAIGVVTGGRDITLMIKQPVEDVHGFACSRRDHLGVERRVSVGQVGVEFDPRVVAVVGVEGLLALRPNPPARKNWPSDDDVRPSPNNAASGSRCC